MRAAGWSRLGPRSREYGIDETRVGAAAAQVAIQGCRHLVAGGPGMVAEQCRRPHHDPGDAVAALPGLQLEERRLHRVRGVGSAEASQRSHLTADVFDGRVTRRRGMTTDPD